MSHSQRLRLCDVRGVYRLIGEVSDLGNDAVAWKRHLVEGLVRLVGGQVAGYTELSPMVADTGIRARGTVSTGWERPEHEHLHAQYLAAGDFSQDPVMPAILARCARGRPFTALRHQVVGDDPWYRSAHAHENCRPFNIDSFLQSQVPLPRWGCVSFITLSRPWGDRPLAQRQRRVIHLCNLELGRLWTRSPFADTAHVLDRLPRRLRQTLDGLCAGENEPRIADRLGLSRHTVHRYVSDLHRRLGASSRGELLATVAAANPRLGPRLDRQARIGGQTHVH